MTHHFSRRNFLAYFYLIFSLVIFVLYPLLGFYFENRSFSLETFLNAPVFGNYRLTLSQLLLDVDSFLANFITILLFCLVFAFFCVYYGPPPTELGLGTSAPVLKKRTKLFGGIAAGILGAAILLSVTQIGYIRPELAGQTFEIIFFNFHQENFSVQVYYYLFLFSGWPGILYLAASTVNPRRRASWAGSKTNAGKSFLIISLALVEVLFFVFPLVPWVVQHPNTAVREILFSLFDVFFLTGVVLLGEMRGQKRAISSSNEGSHRDTATAGMAEMVRKRTRFQTYAYIWGLACLVGLIIIGWPLVGGDLTVKISTSYFISRIWGFVFTVTLIPCLIAWGRLWMVKHRQTGEIA